MTEAAYALAPAWLAVRELRYRVTARGRRTRVVTIATTPLDPARYPKRAIAAPYGLRWEIETNFRHLKGTMGMGQLKCQTAEGVAKELMIFVLVYNLIRAAMTAAGARPGVRSEPGQLRRRGALVARAMRPAGEEATDGRRTDREPGAPRGGGTRA